MAWRPKADQAVPEEAPAPTADDDVLAQRLAELTHREVALRRITDAVEKQRTRLEERERALERSTSAAAATADGLLADAKRRAERAEQRVHELERQLGERQLGELESGPEPQAPEVATESPAASIPVAPPRPRIVDAEAESTYTLRRLERLVHEAELRGDPQAEEWAYYLPLLREHAEPDGRLPAEFAALVDSIFAA